MKRRLLVTAWGIWAGAVTLAPATTQGADDLVDRGWAAETRLLFDQAREHFASAMEQKPTPEAALGLASALLNVQPRTEANAERAAALLQGILDAGAPDDAAAEALYLLARIEQFHLFTPRPDEAARHYEQLIQRVPKHPLAQMALVKLALLRLYDPAISAAERQARFASFTDRATALDDPVARRDAHLALAAVAQRFGMGDQAALDHLLAAEAAGVSKPTTLADLLVRIGETARILGRQEVAVAHYQRFLEQFPRDARAFTVRERLRQLASGTPDGAP